MDVWRAASVFAVLLISATPAITGDHGSQPTISGSTDIYMETFRVMAEIGGDPCRNHTRDYLRSLSNLTTWAVQMFDAGAKVPGGIVSGNYYKMGDFDECITSRGMAWDGSELKGKYCLASVELKEEQLSKMERLNKNPQPVHDIYAVDYDPLASVWEIIEYKGDKSKHRRDKIKWAFCLPAACSSRDLEEALNHVLHKMGPALGVIASSSVDNSLCTVQESIEWSGYDYTFCILVALLLFLNITSTIWDILLKEKNITLDVGQYHGGENWRLLSDAFLCFSIRKIFTNLPQKKGNAGGLNIMFGLRFISMAMIILCHCVLNVIQGPIMNAEMIERGNRNPMSLWLLHGDLVVDTFFSSGAFLLAYFLLLELEKRKISTLKLLFFRYVRLTPTVLFIVLFYASLLNKMGTGPFWNANMNRERDNCQNNWWTNVLYVNNYVHPDKMCVLQSWYLPCDTHFFILSIPLLQLLHARSRIGIAVLFVATVISVSIPAIITYVWHLDATLIFYLDSFFNDMSLSNKQLYDVYYPSHSRAGSYMAGLIAGYLHYWMQIKDKKLSKVTHIILFLSGILFVCGPIYYSGLFYTPGRPYYPVEAALYAGLNRFIWGAGIAMIITSMSSGNLGVIGDIFSHKVFIVLGKLTYSAYLCHFVFQLLLISMRRGPMHVNIYDMIGLWLLNLVATYVVSLFLYMMIECPFRDLAGLTQKKRSK